jgi:putative chitinase
MAQTLTSEMLRQVMPHCPKARRDQVLPVLLETCVRFQITTYLRVAAFLATLAVESAEFHYTAEIADGNAYEGRKDLGNTQPGDGARFKGHGFIQITGRANHRLCGEAFRVDLLAQPELLTKLPLAMQSAGWFFAVFKKLNPLADRRQFLATQTAINGKNKTGLPNGWAERSAYYNRALRALPEDLSIGSPPAPGSRTAAALDVLEDPDNVSIPDDVLPSDVFSVLLPSSEPGPEASQSSAEVSSGLQGAQGTKSPAAPAQTGEEAPASAPVVLQKSPVSNQARAIGGGSIVGALLTVISAIAASGKDHVVLIVVCGFALGLVCVGLWFYNESAKRAQARTLKSADIMADKSKNDVQIH